MKHGFAYNSSAALAAWSVAPSTGAHVPGTTYLVISNGTIVTFAA